MAHSESSGLKSLFRLLVAHRLLIYFGGLFVIGLPLLFGALGIQLSGTARTVLVVVTLAVMVLTYIGERRIGFGRSRAEPTTDEYPLKMRVMLALAVLGIAVGIYVALEVNPLTGLLFIAGAYFFGYMGYRGGLDEDEP
jgi:polyferredoxin